MPSIKAGFWDFPKAKIYYKHYYIPKPRAVIIFVHGLGEHCERYNHVFDWFVSKNIACFSFDHHGHGQSGYRTGDVPSYESLLDEIDYAQKHLKKYYECPIGIYGHSMGGNIALNYVCFRPSRLSFCISSAAWLELAKPPHPFLLWVARIANFFGGIVQDNGLELKGLSRDQAVIDRYIKDSLVHPKISSKLAIGNIDSAAKILSKKIHFKMPLLVMHGSADILTHPPGSKKFVELHGGNITYKPWEGWYHELHNEPEKEELFMYVYDWLQKIGI